MAERLAEHAHRRGCAHPSVARQLELVMTLSAEQRGRMVGAWAERHRIGADEPALRDTLVWLPARVGQDLPGDPLGQERAARLAEPGARHQVWYGEAAEILVAAELAAGRRLPAEAVAALRRGVLLVYGAEELGAVMKQVTEPPVNVGEEWADRTLADAGELGAPWPELLRLAATATAARPASGWEKKARALLDPLDPDAAHGRMLGWLALVGRPRTLPYEPEEWQPDANSLFDPFNANALRGICWLPSLLPPHPDTARALGALVETSLRKVPGVGPRNPKVANAAVTALSRTEGEAAPAELARLASRITFKGTLKQVEAALEARAAALGLSRDEVEELAVPAYGLTEVGRLPHEHGELAVVAGKAVPTWRNAAGKPVKAVPAAVRRDHAEQVAVLRTAAKDVDRMLAAQAERLDRQFLARRAWTHAAWRARYLDHPLTGTLARRLLWTVDGRACGYAEGGLRTLSGDRLGPVDDGAVVELWHPVGREPAEVVAWRDWLERYGITQPFKQAHREVYPLTDAARATDTYSDRFAAHVLRQHQFNSLAALSAGTAQAGRTGSPPPGPRPSPRSVLRGDQDAAQQVGQGAALGLGQDAQQPVLLVADRVQRPEPGRPPLLGELHVDPAAVLGGGGAAHVAAAFQRVEPAGDGGGRHLQVRGELGGGRAPAPPGEAVQGVVLVLVQVEVRQRTLLDPPQVVGEYPDPGHGALDVGVEGGQKGRPALDVAVGPVARGVGGGHGQILRRAGAIRRRRNIR